MATFYDAIFDQYGDYAYKLANKRYKFSELAETITVKGAALLTLYLLSALENNSTHMSEILAEMEILYNNTLTAPAIVLSGLETEAVGARDVAVTAGSQSITFPISLSSTDYALFITSRATDGTFNNYKMTNKLTTGFTIEVADNGYIDYRAIIV
jgi:hypothetical protein